MTEGQEQELHSLEVLEYKTEKRWAKTIMSLPAFSEEREQALAQAYAEIAPNVSQIAALEGRNDAAAFGAKDVCIRGTIFVAGNICRPHDKNDPLVFFEAGIGKGTVIRAMSELDDVKVLGCDVYLIEELKTEFPQVIEADCLSALRQFADSSIDFFYWNDVMEHIPPDEIDVVLDEFRRVLRTGGIILTITPNRLSGPHDITGRVNPAAEKAEGLHLREYSLREVSAKLRKRGFVPAATAMPVRYISKTQHIDMRCPHLLNLYCRAWETITHSKIGRIRYGKTHFAPNWTIFRKR